MAIGFLGLLLINTALFIAGSILQHQLSKAPEVKPGEPQVPTADQSVKLPVIFGTVRLTMNVFRLGKMVAEPIKIRQNTSLITYHTPTVAYAYHWWLMGWLCYGRLTAVLDVIFEGNKPVTQYGTGKVVTGTLTRVVATPGGGFVSYEEPIYSDVDGIIGDGAYMGLNAPDGYALDITAPDLFGGVDFKTGAGQGGVVGRIRIYNGNGEHNNNAEMQNIANTQIGPTHALYPYTEPSYKDWAYAVFENIYMGTQPQCPPTEFIVARPSVFKFGLGNPFLPLEVAAWGGAFYTYRYGACNPASIIAEIMLNVEWGLGWSRDMIDMGMLATLYDIFQPDVGGFPFALCGKIEGDMTGEDAIAEIMRHIDGVMYLSPVTGKITFWLMRGKDEVFGYGAVTDLPLIHPGNAAMVTWDKVAQRPGINEVVVEFSNVEKGFLKDTVRVQNLAAIQAAGRINSETVQYMWITGKTLATIVGQRDLRAVSQDIARGEVEMNREGMAFHPGQWARLTWPEFGITDLVIRIGNIDSGTLKNGKVKLTITEDYWSQESPSYAVINPGPPTQNLQPYRSPTVEELTLGDGLTARTLGLSVIDPDGHVTNVEFFLNGALVDPLSPMLSVPYIITVPKLTTRTQLVCYKVTYTAEDGTDDTIEGCFPDVPVISEMNAPTLSYAYVGTDVVIDSSYPAGATGVKFAWAINTKPTDTDVYFATPDTTVPYSITVPAPVGTEILYVRAAAWTSVDNSDSLITSLVIPASPTVVASALINPTIQYPFGNGTVMGVAGDWLAASPDFNGNALRWKARFLNASRAQVTGSATFSVKKVQEAGGALIDMVGGVLTIATDDENAENGGSASGWAVPGFNADDEIIVTLETLTNPNSATSLLFTLTVEKV